MTFHRALRGILSLLGAFSCAFASPTVSVFVKDASDFENIRKTLSTLNEGLGAENPEVQQLLERAGKIAEMNDRCAMISINEMLDESCGQFYAVDLPQFEDKFMELTGELRLRSLKMGSSLAERTAQIQVCASALGGILTSKDRLLKMNGNVSLEPLTMEGAFDATYDFSLYFDAGRMELQKSMMERWVAQCGDIVLRKERDEFAPLFVDRVSAVNDSLKAAGANVKIVLEPEFLDFYLDLNKPVSGAYYMNGARIFAVDSLPTGRNYAHLIVSVLDKVVNAPLGVDGKMQNFRGRVEFTSAYQESDLMGRWSWGDLNSVNQAVAKGEISSYAIVGDSTKPVPVVKHLQADSAAVNVSVEQEKAEVAASSAAAEPVENAEKRGRSWLPQIISGVVFVGGTIMAVAFNSKAKSERDKKPADAADYDKICDNIESAQNMRTVGFGIAALGLVGFGVSFLF